MASISRASRKVLLIFMVCPSGEIALEREGFNPIGEV